MPFFEPGNFTAGTLIGMVLGAYLNHSLAIRRSNFESVRKGYNEAAKNFRDSFTCVIQAFPHGRERMEHIIINNIKTQEIAMIELKRHLIGKAKTEFEETWQEYQECSDNFHGGYELKVTEQEFLAEFEKFINKLISFAKHK